MKANVTKLTVLVVIVAIAMFMPVGMTLAGQLFPQPFRHSIQGVYAATGFQMCLLAQCGFLENFVPRAASYGFGSTQSLSIEGVFKFERDGTGEASITKRSINFAPTLPPDILSASAGVVIDTWTFTYTVTGDGSYTMKPDKDSYKSKWTAGPYDAEFTVNGWLFNGSISPDGKTITLNTGVPVKATLSPAIVGPPCPLAQLICNTSAVLIWQHDINEE